MLKKIDLFFRALPPSNFLLLAPWDLAKGPALAENFDIYMVLESILGGLRQSDSYFKPICKLPIHEIFNVFPGEYYCVKLPMVKSRYSLTDFLNRHIKVSSGFDTTPIFQSNRINAC